RKAPSCLTLVQPDDRVEVPGAADFNHIVFASQRLWKRYVRLLALHDLSYRVIDLRYPAGEFKGHRLHGTVASNGDRHHWIPVRPVRHLTDRFDLGVELESLGPRLRVLYEFDVGVAASEQLHST